MRALSLIGWMNSERNGSTGRDAPLMVSGRKGDVLMTERKGFVFKFADVEVREREFLLIKAGERIAIEPKAFRVLLFLLRNPGRLIPKDEIVGSVWDDSAVSDNSLTRSIAQLRRVLGDDTREPVYILTVPTVGYRFLCEVNAVEDAFSTSPRPEMNRNEDNGLRDQGKDDLALDLEEKPRGASSKESASTRRMFFPDSPRACWS